MKVYIPTAAGLFERAVKEMRFGSTFPPPPRRRRWGVCARSDVGCASVCLGDSVSLPVSECGSRGQSLSLVALCVGGCSGQRAKSTQLPVEANPCCMLPPQRICTLVSPAHGCTQMGGQTQTLILSRPNPTERGQSLQPGRRDSLSLALGHFPGLLLLSHSPQPPPPILPLLSLPSTLRNSQSPSTHRALHTPPPSSALSNISLHHTHTTPSPLSTSSTRPSSPPSKHIHIQHTVSLPASERHPARTHFAPPPSFPPAPILFHLLGGLYLLSPPFGHRRSPFNPLPSRHPHLTRPILALDVSWNVIDATA